MSEYWDGIKLAIKLVEADAIIINIRTRLVINKLSNFPMISEGFVNIVAKFAGSCFKKASAPKSAE